MIGRTNRFHGRNALNAVYRRGSTVRAPMLNLRFASRDPRRPYRVAVVVSRKVSKSAVTRNRIRRRIYAAVRREAPHGAPLLKPGTDLVFTAFSDKLASEPVEKLEKTVAELLAKASRQAGSENTA